MSYIRPRTLPEAVQRYAETPDCRPLAGGTDVMVMLKAGAIRSEVLLDLWSVRELKGIRGLDGFLEIGAAEPYTGIIRSALVREHVPALVHASLTIGAAQIQNRGTLGGNLANASPAGDTLPVLLAADAVVVTDRREIAVAEFFTGYRRTALERDELIVAVRLPLDGRRVRFCKVGTRAAQAISKVVVALSTEPPRVALGSVAEVPLRAPRAEAALAQGDVAGALAALDGDIRPIDDVRSTAAYRRAVARNVVRRLLES